MTAAIKPCYKVTMALRDDTYFCDCCGETPWHPATGGLHDNGKGGYVAWCGPCEQEMVKFLVFQSKRTFKTPAGHRIHWDGTPGKK